MSSLNGKVTRIYREGKIAIGKANIQQVKIEGHLNKTICCSVTKSCPTLCDPRLPCSTQASLSFIISQSLLKLMSTESVILSNRLILCCPLLLLLPIFPNIRIFSNELALHIRWSKYWSFSFSTSPSNEYSGLISLGWTGWISLQSQGLSDCSPIPQFKSINSSALSFLYSPAQIYMTTGKNQSFDNMDLCQQNNVSAF